MICPERMTPANGGTSTVWRLLAQVDSHRIDGHTDWVDGSRVATIRSRRSRRGQVGGFANKQRDGAQTRRLTASRLTMPETCTSRIRTIAASAGFPRREPSLLSRAAGWPGHSGDGGPATSKNYEFPMMYQFVPSLTIISAAPCPARSEKLLFTTTDVVVEVLLSLVLVYTNDTPDAPKSVYPLLWL